LTSSTTTRRPDVVAAERLVLAAFRNLEATKLALLPTFALAFDGGRLSDALLSLGTRVGTWAEASWSIYGRYLTRKGDGG